MKVILTALCIALSAAPAFSKSSAKPYAPAIWKFDNDVIRSSIKCEIGRVANTVNRVIPANKALAQITVELENTQQLKSGLKAVFPWLKTNAELTRERTIVDGEKIQIVYNISKENAVANCAKHNKFKIGIYDCLTKNLNFWKEISSRSGSFTCSSSVNVALASSGSLGGKVWVIDVGGSASSTEKAVYKFTVVAPAPSK